MQIRPEGEKEVVASEELLVIPDLRIGHEMLGCSFHSRCCLTSLFAAVTFLLLLVFTALQRNQRRTISDKKLFLSINS